MDRILEVANVFMLSVSWLVILRAVYGIEARNVPMCMFLVVLLSGAEILFKTMFSGSIAMIATILVGIVTIMVASKKLAVKAAPTIMLSYLLSKAMSWGIVSGIGCVLYPIFHGKESSTLVVGVKILITTIALIGIMLVYERKKTHLKVRSHTILSLVLYGLIICIALVSIQQPFEIVGTRDFIRLLMTFGIAIIGLVVTSILDTKDDKREHGYLVEKQRLEEDNKQLEEVKGKLEEKNELLRVQNQKTIALDHTIKEDLIKELRKAKLEAEMDSDILNPEKPVKAAAARARKLEKIISKVEERTARESREEKSLRPTGISALDKRLDEALVHAGALDVDLDLIVPRMEDVLDLVALISVPDLRDVMGILTDSAICAASVKDSKIKHVYIICTDVEGDIPVISIFGTSADFPTEDEMESVEKLLSSSGASIEINTKLPIGDVCEKEVRLVFDGKGRVKLPGLPSEAEVSKR